MFNRQKTNSQKQITKHLIVTFNSNALNNIVREQSQRIDVNFFFQQEGQPLQPETTKTSNLITIKLTLEEVCQYHGLLSRGLVRPRSIDTIKQLLTEIEEQQLVKGQISFSICPIESIEYGKANLGKGNTLIAPLVASRLEKASHMLVAVVTLGDIATTIRNLFKTGRRLDAVILEELATFCLIKLSSELEKLGAQEAERMDLSISGSLNPGDHDGFALSTQKLILKMANADSIGVVLTSTQMMSPQHSLSVVYGLGQLMPRWTQLENCSNCDSRNKCPHVLALEA